MVLFVVEFGKRKRNGVLQITLFQGPCVISIVDIVSRKPGEATIPVKPFLVASIYVW